MTKKARIIVLDLDHTMTCGKNKHVRPGLEDFLQFCFEEASHVIVWTAANEWWCDVAMNELIMPVVRSIQERAGGNTAAAYDFSAIYCDDKCDYVRDPVTNVHEAVKKLDNITNRDHPCFFGVDDARIILIDDNPIHCAYNDAGSVILVPQYRGGDTDTALTLVKERIIDAFSL